jgi:CDP-diacylglycerol--glycerol-3-phosphate 3-phosphatidyltransferase
VRGDLAAVLAILAFAVATMPVFGWLRSPERDPLESSARGTFVLGGFVRSWFYWFIRPVERASIAVGASPLVYNLAGVAFGSLAGVFYATGHMVAGGWAVLLGGAADVLDGRVARARGLASRRGAFLDSTLDRFAEFGVFVGLAYWFRGDGVALVLVTLTLGGSLLVSYARARGESVGVVCTVGVLQRAERLLLLGFGGLFDPPVSRWMGRSEPGGLLLWILGLMAVGTVGTAVFRTVWIARRLPRLDPPEEEEEDAGAGKEGGAAGEEDGERVSPG